MRSVPRLGSVNAALVSLYFAPVWGIDAVRALTSPYYRIEDRAHAAATDYFRQLLDLGLDGLWRVSSVLAAIELIIAAGFVAYLIDFSRGLAVGREPDRVTRNAVLALASAASMVWAWSALASGDGSLIRLQATQFLLLAGAIIVILVDRLVETTETSQLAASSSREPRSSLAVTAPMGNPPLGISHLASRNSSTLSV
jgi:hypothetical protein